MPADLPQHQIGNVGPSAIVLQGKSLSVGVTAEQVRALIEAATKGADERLAEASRRLGVTQGAMRTMLATVGQVCACARGSDISQRQKAGSNKDLSFPHR